jgi:LemA protein
MPNWLIYTIVIIVVLYFIVSYNRLVTLKHNVDEAWSNIDVLLKQRYEELPKLIETCRQYMVHERATLTEVTELRNKAETARREGDTGQIGMCEGALGIAVSGLLARAEAYPDLKASETFKALMSRIGSISDNIADRRELFNESVNLNNIRRQQFPDVLVARLFGFGPRKLFEVAEEKRANVDVHALFDR